MFLAALLVWTIFGPTGEWAVQAIFRGKFVHAAGMQAQIPRPWVVRGRNSRMEVWRPRLTSFSSSPSASMSFKWMGDQTCDQEIILRATSKVTGTPEWSDRTNEVKIGTVALACLEPSQSSEPNQQMYSCFNSTSCILGSFKGPAGDLPTFRQIEATAQLDHYNLTLPPH